ncbi:hypothetical protein B0E53_01166 [Micromonospora sp. MH33]|uniref:hypothetical protein n=1 Tax=Micromonospora sp. MH33 TaxID=1945509 RepID=UPI000D2E7971|nr:hypothetical protein [Micromonospora sp. MH33]PSK66831.1 hypothetical protein B0E53_01166 [Micromonospora sp. MH33]
MLPPAPRCSARCRWSSGCGRWPGGLVQLGGGVPAARALRARRRAFQLGIGATLLLALIWADALAVALAGYIVGAAAHTVSHVVDADLGGSAAQIWAVSVAVAGERAYVRSFEKAWKTRRIRSNPHVTLAPSTALGKPTGEAVEAVARRLSGAEYRAASRALVRKHPLLHGVLVPLTHRLGRTRTGRTGQFALSPSSAAGQPAAAGAGADSGRAR